MAKMLIKGIQEKLDKLEKSNPLKYKTNGGKNKKKNWFMLHFDCIARVWVLSNEVEDTPLQQFLILYFNSIIQKFSLEL